MDEKTLKLISDINKKFKKVVVTPASSTRKIPRIRSYDCVALDYCMGGGFPFNKIVEFYGPESAGKTWAALLYTREFQRYDFNNEVPRGITQVLKYKERVIKNDFGDFTFYTAEKVESVKNKPETKNVIIIDTEGTYDKDWGEYLGIDNKLLIHCVPETGEQAVDIAEIFLSDPNTGLVLFDSVGATKPSAEIAKSMEDQNMGVTARFWNRAMAKFQMALNRNPCKYTSIILINRSYEKIGMVFGNPEQVANGSGIKFAKSVSLKISKSGSPTKEKIDGEDVITGQLIKIENKKNKTGKPFKTANCFFCMLTDEETDVHYGFPDHVIDLVELGLTTKIIEQPSARTFKYGAIQGSSRADFIDKLRKSKRAQRSLYDSILSQE